MALDHRLLPRAFGFIMKIERMDFVEFPTTMWSGIRAAGNENALEANEVSRRYRPAVVTFLRQKGYSLADSEDLTQNVFLRLFGRHVGGGSDKISRCGKGGFDRNLFRQAKIGHVQMMSGFGVARGSVRGSG